MFSLRLFLRLALVAVCLSLAVALWLTVAQVPVPDRVLRAALARLDAPENPFFLDIAAVDFSLSRVNLRNVQIIQKGSLDGPVLSLAHASLHLTPAWARDPSAWVSRVVLTRLDAPALPDVLRGGPAAPRPMPKIPATRQPLGIELHDARVFDVPFHRLAACLETTETTLDLVFTDFHLHPPHAPNPEHGRGALRFDAATQTLSCAVHGSVSVAHVASFIESWGIPMTQRILRRIVLAPPYPAMSFRVESARAGFDALDLSLSFGYARGAYQGVPLQLSSGNIRYVETNEYSRLELRDFRGSTPFAPARLDLTLLDDTVDVNASATLPLASFNLLAGNPFTPGELEPFATLGPVSATVNGRLDTHTNNAWRATDFRGVFFTEESSLLGLPLAALTGGFAFTGPRLAIEPFTFATPGSGRLSGSLLFDLLPAPGTLSGTVNAAALSLAELPGLPAAAAQPGELQGGVTFTSGLDAPGRILDAAGSCAISNARLARIPLFAWLTEFMAAKIPGVDWLTQQTDATCAFTIADGVLAIKRLAITGGAFTVRGRGSYDISADALDLTFEAHLFGDRNLFQYLTLPVTSAINSVLFTFRVTGARGDPAWRNVGFVPRVLRGVGGAIFSLFTDDDE